MSAELWIQRARSAVGRLTMYWAGAGGRNPQAPQPGSEFLAMDLGQFPRDASLREVRERAGELDANGHIDYSRGALRLQACDCSGFVCWVLGVPRSAQVGGQTVHLNTDAIWSDAREGGAHRFFVALPAPAVGCLAVYPRPADGSEPFGHVAIVSALDEQGMPSRYIHCAGDNYRDGLDAILENHTDRFDRQANTLHVWPASVALP